MEKTILFVDNDIFSSRIISRLLSGLYNLVIKSSGDEALTEIENGLKPDIIMSTRVLKGMDGVTFLKKVSKILPNSFRIFVTAETNPKILFDFIKESGVQLYLNKPFNSLQLIQILKLTSRKSTVLSESVKEVESTHQLSDKSSVYKEFKLLESKHKLMLENTISSSNDNIKQIIRAVSTFIDSEENFYFRKHTPDVVEMCRYLSATLHIEDEKERTLLYVALIHNFYIINLPDYFKLVNPFELNDNDKSLFFDYFNKTKQNLLQIKSISKYVELASMIFENVAGKGEPLKLTGLDIPKEIQLLIMANIYHNLVYRVKPEDLAKLKSFGFLIQSRSDTIKRHQDSITYFYKNIKHFDHDLFYKFQDVIKKREYDVLKFNDKDLKITYDKKINADLTIDSKSKDIDLLKKLTKTTSSIIIKNEADEVIDSYEEERCNLIDLKIGDILTRAIKTNSGVQIVSKDITLTEEIIEKIINSQMKQEISEIVYRKVIDNN